MWFGIALAVMPREVETAFLRMIDVMPSHRSLHRPAPATLSIIRHPLINEYKTKPQRKTNPEKEEEK